ncbi:MAG: radical SAM protein [Desulfurococcaceae archaeon]
MNISSHEALEIQVFTVVFRKFLVHSVFVDKALSKSGLPDLTYALNPYIGCSHGCVYCYARLYTRDKRVSENWGRIVLVKENLPKVLEWETRTLKKGVVGVGTITDAYQPVEAVYRVTRRCLEILLKAGFEISIQTKNPLVLRDMDLLAEHRDKIDIGFTITSLDREVARFIEPNSPSPMSRANALREIREIGIKTWLFYGPIIPGLNDDYETMKAITEIAADTGSTLYYDPLHVKAFMRDQKHPLNPYLYRMTSNWRKQLEKKLINLCMKHGLTCKPGFRGDA